MFFSEFENEFITFIAAVTFIYLVSLCTHVNLCLAKSFCFNLQNFLTSIKSVQSVHVAIFTELFLFYLFAC